MLKWIEIILLQFKTLYYSTVAIMFLFGITTLHAQSVSVNYGTISGKIVDSETGEALRSGSVLLVGHKKGAYSDVKGEFKIKGIPPGVYSLKVSYISYLTKEINGIEIKSGENLDLGNILLESQIKTTQDVVVEARWVKDNGTAILNMRKNSTQISDGISREEISKLPDADAGQSLKRVSGITLVNDKFVYIRGVSERYSNTMLNGASLSTTEPDKRAFAFDMFPSDYLESINVTKSFTPDLPGNFAGGLVQLKTVDFPDGFSLKISLGSTYNSNVSFKENAFITYNGGSKDWLGIDDGTRSLPSGFPERKELNELQRNANNPFDETGAVEKYETLSKTFKSSLWKRQSETIDLLDNRSIGLSFTDLMNFADDELGIIGTFNYDISNSINIVERNAYLGNLDTLYYSKGTQFVRNVGWGGMLNIAYKLSSHSSFNFKNIYNISSDDHIVSLVGSDIGYQFQDYKKYQYEFTGKTLLTSQISGEHIINFMNNIFLDWTLGFSQTARSEPDLRRLRFARQIASAETNSNEPFLADIDIKQQGDGTRVGRFYSDLYDKVWSGAINFNIPIKSFKLKVGGLIESRKRSFDARSLTIIQSNLNVSEDIYERMSDYNHPEKLFDENNFRYADGLMMSEDSHLSDSYNGDEDLKAAYLMSDIPFSFLKDNFRIVAGLRFESNKLILNSHLLTNEPVNVNRIDNDILPSINFIWVVNKNTNLRVSASQTLTRPSFREIAPFAFYNYLIGALVQGNPKLTRTLIQNYDLRYEYFPNPGEVFSASFFYKNFQNAIEETIYPQQSELTRTWANAEGNAVNYGFEIEAKCSLEFIASVLEYFALNMNFTLINSKLTVLQGSDGTEDTRPMWGQSPYTINIGLFYTNPDLGTSINIAYNKFGKRIIQVAQRGVYVGVENPHAYELPRDVLDLSVNQMLFNMMELKLQVNDLLSQPLIWEQAGKKVASNLRGTNVSFGVSYLIK